MNQDSFHVYFGTTLSPLVGFGEQYPYVVLVRQGGKSGKWTQRAAFTYHLHLVQGDKGMSGDVLVGFISDKDQQTKKRFEAGDEKPVPAEQYPGFYTLQPNMQAYRHIVGKLRNRNARRFLVAINDLVAIRNIGAKRAVVRSATETRLFMSEFLRDTETFFAFYNADSVLRGLRREDLTKVSNSLELTFQLRTFKILHHIPIRFDATATVPKRMFVIIGKNGTGKSRSLYNFAESLLRDDGRVRTSDGDRPLLNRLLAVCSPGETSTSFPPQSRTKRLPYLRVMLGRERPGSGVIGLGEAVVRLARSEESIAGLDRWQIFTSAVSTIIPTEDVFVPMTTPKYPLPLRRSDLGSTDALRHEMARPVDLPPLTGPEARRVQPASR